MSELDADLPPGELRAPALRVEHRGGRLVVQSGPPPLLVALPVVALPSMMLLALLGSGAWKAESAPALLMPVAVAAVLWVAAGSWTLTLDRREGMARLRRGPWRSRRPLAGLVGVRFFSLRQAQIDRVRRRRAAMSCTPAAETFFGVALVDGAGRWWRVTRPEDRSGRLPRREDAEQAARLVASYLGIPFLPPYETPPGRAAPPALEEGAAREQHG